MQDGNYCFPLDIFDDHSRYVIKIKPALRTGGMVIIKGADGNALVNGEPDPGNPNVYEAFGGIDNIYEENQYMEFNVRRYEVNG